MTPAELYSLPPESIENNVRTLTGCYYNHVPELGEYWAMPDVKMRPNERVEIRVHRHHQWDHRRFWRLASVWFDGKPVMVIQNAGREGDDHRMRYVTDHETYAQMVGYLMTLPILKPDEDRPGQNTRYVAPDTDLGDELTTFYNESMDSISADYWRRESSDYANG